MPLSGGGGALAQDIPVLSSTNDLHALTQGVWTNTHTLMILPPGLGQTRHALGVVAFDQTFDPAFLAALDPVTIGGVTRYPLEAVETNTVPRTRRYLNATGGLVQTTGVPAGYDPTQLVHAAYGTPPAWLSAPDRALWYEDRMPDRIRVSAELIATSAVPAYLALLTNGIGTGWDGVTNVPLLTLYSNDLALVRMEQASEQVAAWVHAPAGVGRVDLYGSGDLLFPLGWQLLATLGPGADPRYWSGSSVDPLRTLAAGNPGLDGDSDGLADARELLLYGTDPEVSDTDGDGLLDGEEINRYDLDPMDADTDGDGYTDGAEVALGMNPTNPGDGRVDTDGDGVPDTMETAAGCTSPAQADVFTTFQLARFLGFAPIRVTVGSTFTNRYLGSVNNPKPGSTGELTQVGMTAPSESNQMPCVLGTSTSYGDGGKQYVSLACENAGSSNQALVRLFMDHYDPTPQVYANGVTAGVTVVGAVVAPGQAVAWNNVHDTTLVAGPVVTPNPTGVVVTWTADFGFATGPEDATGGGYGYMNIPLTPLLPQLQIAPTAAYRCVGGGAVTLSVAVANMAWTGEIWWAVTPTGAGGPRFAVGGGVTYSGGTNAVLQMGTNPGVYTVTASPRGIAPLAATATVVVLRVELKELEFKQDNPVRNDSGSAYSGADWQDNDLDGDVLSDADDKRQPASYKRGEQISVAATWEVAPASDLDVGNWRVRGTGPDGIKIGFAGGGIVVTLAGSTLSMTETACDASTQLPNTVRYYSSFEISWELSLDGGATWPCSAGKSDNLLYVTYGEPETAATMCHTPLHIGCSQADGESDHDSIVSKIFDKFETLTVRTVDPKTGAEILVFNPMQYYGSGPYLAYPSPFLGPAGNGQCGTWVLFLVDIYQMQGISDCVMINVGPDPWAALPGGKVPRVPTPGNWIIHGIVVKATADGQGPTAPPSAANFCNHFLVKASIGGVGHILGKRHAEHLYLTG